MSLMLVFKHWLPLHLSLRLAPILFKTFVSKSYLLSCPEIVVKVIVFVGQLLLIDDDTFVLASKVGS